MATQEGSSVDDVIAEPGIEPGASAETMLVTTDSFEEYEQEMSNSIDDRQMKESTASTISELQEEVRDIPTTPIPTSPAEAKPVPALDDSELVSLITSKNSRSRGGGGGIMLITISAYAGLAPVNISGRKHAAAKSQQPRNRPFKK